MSKYFSLIYSGDIRRSRGKKIVPAEALSTLLEASELLKQTQADMAQYLEHNQAECRRLLAEAQEAGFNQGLAEFNKQILYYQKKEQQLAHEFQKQLLPLALLAAKKIVGSELALRPEAIVDIVQQLLKQVTQSHQIKIIVSKENKKELEKEKQKLKATLEHVKLFLIEERGDLLPGDCIIETEAGIINASLENQWRSLTTALNAFMKNG